MTPTVFIKAVHSEPGAPGELTGLSFTVKYDRATVLVSIQEMPPEPFQDRLAAYRAAIEGLAQALLRTARNPQWITENPEPQG